MLEKVKECKSCGQGFSEHNVLVGSCVPSTRCNNGRHDGPIERVTGALTTATATADNLKDFVESIVDARVRQMNLPGDKGSTTYAESIQKLVLRQSFIVSPSLDMELEDKVTFPAQVAAQMPKKVLREASMLCVEERTAEKANMKLMHNLNNPQSTQDFVSAVMVKLKEDMYIYTPEPTKFQIASYPSPMAYYQKSFGNRSPDLPFYSRATTTSPYCITFILDVKPCADGDFTDEQMGHIVDMVYELLTTEQTGRKGMICGLTDGSRFQFFRVLRPDTGGGADDIQVDASRIFKDQEGWQVLIALMALSLVDPFLMHKEHRVAGLHLHSILGHGARSTVYKVELDAAEESGVKGGDKAEGESQCSGEDRCLLYCKVYTKSPEGELGQGAGWQGFDRERAALLRLQGVLNIPKIHQVTSTLRSIQSRSRQDKTERVLVLSPVGLPLWPVRDEVVVTGRHFAQLVTTVEAMHSAGVLHRDIKPANVFLQEDVNLLLLADFDAAVLLEEMKDVSPQPPMQQKKVQTRSGKVKATAPEESLTLETLTLDTLIPTNKVPKVYRQDQQFVWVGTVGYSDTRPTNRNNLHTPTPEHDLVALVRTVYSLYTNKRPTGPRDDGDTYDYDTDAYWAERIPAASMWQDFLQMARGRDYEALRLALGKL